uniref:AMP-binding enzyme C-terminal domain-containing protein n=1 Tax=Panagrolaimus superbus TaxID=310955 RepID=A0A914Z3S8_9BILA
MAIVNENGNFVKRGEKGELIARGYSVMSGYWNDEEKTKEVIGKDRWYHTGDVASMNPDGSIKISGRYKDMIIRGGENLYPTEIEQFIFKHSAVADAQVVGVPDEIMGEELCAWIRLKPGTVCTAEELTEFLRNKVSVYNCFDKL